MQSESANPTVTETPVETTKSGHNLLNWEFLNALFGSAYRKFRWFMVKLNLLAEMMVNIIRTVLLLIVVGFLWFHMSIGLNVVLNSYEPQIYQALEGVLSNLKINDIVIGRTTTLLPWVNTIFSFAVSYLIVIKLANFAVKVGQRIFR
ncbi:MAG: hypothetical protein K9M11_01815 [Candidatus Pacebacteria bacterium]|nr:hypothetical protein [Candidatus Paceibacterota bacterium]